MRLLATGFLIVFGFSPAAANEGSCEAMLEQQAALTESANSFLLQLASTTSNEGVAAAELPARLQLALEAEARTAVALARLSTLSIKGCLETSYAEHYATVYIQTLSHLAPLLDNQPL